MTEDDLHHAHWHKSSFSGGGTGGGDCVEVAALDDGRAAVRDSKHPGAAVILTRAQMAAFVRGVQASEFDDLD